jgi:hypothetical protein
MGGKGLQVIKRYQRIRKMAKEHLGK